MDELPEKVPETQWCQNDQIFEGISDVQKNKISAFFLQIFRIYCLSAWVTRPEYGGQSQETMRDSSYLRKALEYLQH